MPGWAAEQGATLRSWMHEHGWHFAVLAQARTIGRGSSAALHFRWHRLASSEVATAPSASASAATAAHTTAPSMPAATAPPPQMTATAAPKAVGISTEGAGSDAEDERAAPATAGAISDIAPPARPAHVQLPAIRPGAAPLQMPANWSQNQQALTRHIRDQ